MQEERNDISASRVVSEVAPPRSVPRILLVGTKAKASGAPMALLRLAAGLHDHGWLVRACFLYHDAPFEDADFPATSLLEAPPEGPLSHIRMWVRLIALFKAERPDAVIAFLPYASVLGCLLARVYGVRVRIVSHRVPRTTYGRRIRVLDRAAAWSGLYTDVVAVSRSVAQQSGAYPAWLMRRTRVVHNGLRHWRACGLTTNEARERFGLPASVELAVALGRLDEQKNLALLIEALALTQRPVHLAVAGEGELRASLQELASKLSVADRIHFLGAVKREWVPAVLAAADVFVQPSLFEGQSNALLEALNAGLPCLVSAIDEQIETVSDGAGDVAGAVLPLGQPPEWAAALDRACDDPAWRESARASARRQASRFSFEQMIAGFVEVVSERLNQAP